jgi:peptide/nickel transport system substrate-binding protein
MKNKRFCSMISRSLPLILALTLGMLLLACAPAPAPPAAPATQPPAAATQAPPPTQPPATAPQPTAAPATKAPSKDIVGTFAYPRTMSELDPGMVLSSENNVMFNVYDRLTNWDPDKGLQPRLATSWESNPDSTVWTFHLRQGVKCQDGTAFTADAVKFSFERTIKLGALAYVYASFDKTEVVDSSTVRVTLKNPMRLPVLLANGWGTFIACPGIGDKPKEWFAAGHGIGTGPYMFESYEPGVRLVLTRFNDYWGGWKDGQFTKVVYNIVEDASVREQMLRSGEADIAWQIPFDDFASLNAAGVKTLAVPAYQNLLFHMKTDKGPLKDLRLRQALAYAFPYDAVQKGTFGGTATVAQGPIPQIMWKPPSPFKTYSYDPAKAAALLKDAQAPQGLQILLGVETGDRDTMQASQLWQAELQKLGVNMTIQEISSAVRWDEVYNKDTKFDIMYQHMVIGFASPSDFLGALWNTKLTFYPFSDYNNPKFDAAENQALATEATDKAKSDQLYAQASQMLLDDCTTIFALDLPQDFETSKTVDGFKVNPLYGYVVDWYPLTRLATP